MTAPATKRQHGTGAWLLLALYCLVLPLLRPVVSTIDPVGYYAWARSILIDQSLDTADEFAHYQMPPVPRAPTGYLHNQWAAGSGLTWLPAMSAAHAAVLAADALGAHIDPDGYSWPYVLAAALTSSLAGLAAVLLCRQIALRYAGDFAATTATMAIWLATPFIFFQTVQPLMSHTTDAAANALCILLWLRARQHPDSGSTAFALGAATGAAVWVRAQNGILPAVFALDALLDLLACLWQSSGARALQVARSRLAPLGAGFALLAAPLLLFWRTVYGAWVLNTYTATGGGSFDWSAPHLFDALFSSDRGLFTWAPVTLPAVIGLAVLWRSERRLAIMLGLIGAAHAFVIGSWSAWSGGGTPGPRLWLGILPLFVLGLAALIERARTPRAVTAGAAMALAGWNILLIAQYMLGMVAPEGPVNLAEMAVNQIAVAQRLAGVFLRR